MAGIYVRFEVTPEKFLSDLTNAAYEVALKHGFRAPFDQVELDLLKALRKVIQEEMQVSEACGSQECLALKKDSLTPWSQDANRLFKEEE